MTMIIEDARSRSMKRAEERTANRRRGLKTLKYTGIAVAGWLALSSMSLLVPPQRVLNPSQWKEFSRFKEECDRNWGHVDGKIRPSVDFLCGEEIYRERVARAMREPGEDVSVLRYWQETVLLQTVPLSKER